jgi:predicted ATPase
MQRYFRIDRVVIENYRSILHCDVRLGQITFLVGPNGSGKSNFIDALVFVSDSLRHSLEQAARDRQGIQNLLHAPAQTPGRMTFLFEISSPEGIQAIYSFTIRVNGSIVVEREKCHVRNGDEQHHFLVSDGSVQGTAAVFPPVTLDRLFLINAAGLPEFRPVYDFLSGMAKSEPTTPQRNFVVDYKSRALADELTLRFRELRLKTPARADLVQDYLRAIAEPFDRLDVIEVNNRPWLKFVEKSGVAFSIFEESAGLLHSAGVLLELFEPPKNGAPASLVAIEEPEALLHPAAVSVIRDSFLEASELRQILITSHSPELLDDKSIPGEWIRVVRRDHEGTHIEALDPATESIIRDQLSTAGELLRHGGLSFRSEFNDKTVA